MEKKMNQENNSALVTTKPGKKRKTELSPAQHSKAQLICHDFRRPRRDSVIKSFYEAIALTSDDKKINGCLIILLREDGSKLVKHAGSLADPAKAMFHSMQTINEVFIDG